MRGGSTLRLSKQAAGPSSVPEGAGVKGDGRLAHVVLPPVLVLGAVQAPQEQRHEVDGHGCFGRLQVCAASESAAAAAGGARWLAAFLLSGVSCTCCAVRTRLGRCLQGAGRVREAAGEARLVGRSRGAGRFAAQCDKDSRHCCDGIGPRESDNAACCGQLAARHPWAAKVLRNCSAGHVL